MFTIVMYKNKAKKFVKAKNVLNKWKKYREVKVRNLQNKLKERRKIEILKINEVVLIISNVMITIKI